VSGVWVYNAAKRVDCFSVEELEEMYDETKDYAGATYVGAMLFMAKEAPLLFLAGKVPPDNSVAAHCLQLREYADNSELKAAFESHRSKDLGVDDYDEIATLVCGSMDN
jgi:hypothetical protein